MSIRFPEREHEHERPEAPPLELRVVALLEDLRAIGLFQTGADLPRSPSRQPRTEAAVDTVAATTETATLLHANGRRKGAIIYNDSSATLYVKFGRRASATDWTVKLSQDGSLTLDDGYRGEVTCVFSAGGSGQARVTEYAW